MVAQPFFLETVEAIGILCQEQKTRICRQLKLSPAEYHGLKSLVPQEKLTCQELARRMNLSLSRCSRIIDRLTLSGYLLRSDCSSDRRCKSITLTEKGNGAHQRIQTLRRECEDRLLAGYAKSDLAALKQDLDKLLDSLASD